MSFLPHKKFDILCKLSSFFSCHYELGILGTHNSNSASAQYANIQKNVQFRETGRNVSIVKLARSSYFRIIQLYLKFYKESEADRSFPPVFEFENISWSWQWCRWWRKNSNLFWTLKQNKNAVLAFFSYLFLSLSKRNYILHRKYKILLAASVWIYKKRRIRL